MSPKTKPNKDAVKSSSRQVLDENKVLIDNQICCIEHEKEFCEDCDSDFSDVNLIAQAFRLNNGYLPPPNPKLAKEIADMKKQGNDYFKEEAFDKALEIYSKAIQMSRMRPIWDSMKVIQEEISILLSNRAACFIEKGYFINALYDTEMVTKIRPAWHKGYFRKGRALFGLGRYGEAVDNYERAIALDNTGNNVEVRAHLKEAMKYI